MGDCNLFFIYESLKEEKDIGLLLPFDVIVHEQDGETFISVILLTVVMSMVKNKKLGAIDLQIEEKLKKVFDSKAKSK